MAASSVNQFCGRHGYGIQSIASPFDRMDTMSALQAANYVQKHSRIDQRRSEKGFHCQLHMNRVLLLSSHWHNEISNGHD